ncbi:ABC transporter permease [Foetidibacter luteolus]|uniref:ABC transporter permease n=1 Tax=Foetidibacter luteolus TaxID=2608880 RepID=UPI00129AF4F7|nr:ABC transporter permease [Foetidibacter luteolus]
MFKTNLRFTWRNLLKNKTYSAINIIGLAVSLAACILLLLWVQDELSFDRFHSNSNNIYRLAASFKQEGKDNVWSGTPAPVATFARKELPEVANTCRVTDNWSISLLEYKGKKYFNNRCGLADATFFTMFNFPLVKGNARQPFTDDRSVILSETTAKKFFGEEDPIGKILNADDKNAYHVTGVMKDMPFNSSIRYDIIFDFTVLKRDYTGNDYWKSLDEDWGNYNYSTFLLLAPGADSKKVGQKLANIHRRNQDGEFTKNLTYIPLPLSKVHLYTPEGKDDGITIVKVFIIVAAIILLIACINYVNLVTARAIKRAKEISLRKIIGANKGGLFWQFLHEALMIFLIAMLVATALIYLVMPLYNEIAGKRIVFNPLQGNVLLVYGITLLATMLLAGIYPALSLSSFKPLEAMKGKLSGLGSKVAFRKVLVVVQFSFSIMLIVGTIIIGNQLKYIRQKNLGYNKENLLYFGMRNITEHYDAAKAELLKQPGVVAVTASGADIMNAWSSTGDADWDGKTAAQQTFVINQISAERNFLDVMNLQIVQGKGFSGTPADSTNYLLNETAIKVMSIKDPVGKRFTFHDKKGVIAGVVKDFHFQNLHRQIEPAIIYFSPWRWRMYVKTTAKDASKAVAAVEKIWKQYNPDYPLEYQFLDDAFDTNYRSDIRVGKLFNCFAIITILISCLGLFGLVTYTAETRIKEIGVRKVLGASVPGIVSMLSKDFLKLVGISIVIAFPVAWWALSKMLESYPYRTAISWWVFALAGFITLAIALVTISFQAIKAALANPVKSLRSE